MRWLRCCCGWVRRFWGVLMGVVVLLSLFGLGLLWWVGMGHYLVAPLGFVAWRWFGLLWVLMALPLLRRGLGRWFFWGGCMVLLVDAVGDRDGSEVPEPDGEGLRVVFGNMGDREEGAWAEWLERLQPDLVGMTEMPRPRDGVGAGVEALGLPYVQLLGEHGLASRFPILKAESVWRRPADGVIAELDETGVGRLVAVPVPAVRYEVELPQGPVAVYVLHMRSPRANLQRYRIPKFWWRTWFSGEGRAHEWERLDRFWERQIEVLEAFLEVLHEDELPVVVLGDWNVPDWGPQSRSIGAAFKDAHDVAGKGWGWTFPGDVGWGGWMTRPWLRLDRIVVDGNWEVKWMGVQAADGKSQHRGIAAGLRLARTLRLDAPHPP